MVFSRGVEILRVVPAAGAALAVIIAIVASLFGAHLTEDAVNAMSPAPLWVPQTSPVDVELRGLSVVNSRIAWASGAKGTVLRTLDGENWRVVPVAGAEALDFRDIEAFDANNAIAMSIGQGPASNVYKTADGGLTWRRVFANTEPEGFWDALAFWDPKHGALFGDPVGNRFQVFTTEDGGETWKKTPEAGMPMALPNEGAFAASGSCIVTGPGKRLTFVTGGAAKARVFTSIDQGRTFTVTTSPVRAGAPSKGLFSALWADEKLLLTVGGDYKERALEGVNLASSTNGGARWEALEARPVGFLSSIVRGPAQDAAIVVVGLAGTGISYDRGATWRSYDSTPYNTAGFAREGRTGWAVGPKGLIARWRE